mmetsp:Transcript_13613/g.34241  ORF Transcript_13613/g.34241 Transcript_13613/m.34241 type:complete len:99 (+) Transcript_13613:1381-1677(+)
MTTPCCGFLLIRIDIAIAAAGDDDAPALDDADRDAFAAPWSECLKVVSAAISLLLLVVWLQDNKREVRLLMLRVCVNATRWQSMHQMDSNRMEPNGIE